METCVVTCSKKDSDLLPTSLDQMTGERNLPFSSRCVPRVILAEDDAELRALMAEVLRAAGYDVVEVSDGINLRSRLSYSQVFVDDQFDFDLIVSDIRMPGLSGFTALSNLATAAPLPPIILITAFGDQQTFLQATQLGAAAFFDKPIDLDKFCAFVTELVPLVKNQRTMATNQLEENGTKAE